MRVVFMLALPVMIAGASVAVAQSADAPKQIVLPEGPGKTQVQEQCATCHGLGLVVGQKRSKAEWEATLDLMADRGAQISDADYPVIATYLATHFGPPK